MAHRTLNIAHPFPPIYNRPRKSDEADDTIKLLKRFDTEHAYKLAEIIAHRKVEKGCWIVGIFPPPAK